MVAVAANSTTVTAASALKHLVEDEFVAFNPHLHPDADGDRWLQYGILMPAFGAIGIVSNAIVFVTLIHRNVRVRTTPLSLLLQCLSAYDLMVSLLSVWCFSAPVLDLHFSAEADYARQIHPRLFPYLYAALHMAITGSDYLNLAAAVERYIALDGPFRDRDPGDFKSAGCLPRTTWFYILGILVGTVAFNLPVAWERTAVEQLANSYDRFGELAVYHTSLRTNQLYVKLYRLTLEFLVFKATPWFAFFILFLSLKDRVHFYQKRRVRKTLSVRQYLEVLDSRIILGINGLFYATNALPLFVGASHVFLYPVAHVVDRAAHLCVVLNSALKLFVYLALSHDFRASVRHLAVGHDGWHWMAREERAREFLGHAKVVTFVQSDTSNNLCADVDNEEELLGR